MNNASKSGIGFQLQAGTPVLKRACKVAPQIAAGGLATAAILCVFAGVWLKYSDYQAAQLQRDIEAQYAKAETVSSPVDYLLRCKDQGSLNSFGGVNADCIRQVVKAAQTFQSDRLAVLVTRHITTWLVRTVRLQAAKIFRFSVSSSRF